MKSLLSAIAYCHKYNIVHRDLKPENLMFVNKKKSAQIKITDWGTSKVFNRKEKV